MGARTEVSRREFLQTATVAGAGLVIGFHLPVGGRRGMAYPSTFAPNAWLRINPDESVLVIVDRSEMGQGVTTSLPMLLAEELEADWSKIKIEFAPADKAYINPMFGMQGTGGSTSIRAAYTPLRKAGAAAREMLLTAAAETWGVDKSECRAEGGAVIHCVEQAASHLRQARWESVDRPPAPRRPAQGSQGLEDPRHACAATGHAAQSGRERGIRDRREGAGPAGWRNRAEPGVRREGEEL